MDIIDFLWLGHKKGAFRSKIEIGLSNFVVNQSYGPFTLNVCV